MDIYGKLENILRGIVGDPRREDVGGGGWQEYNCPCCAEENFGEPDGKYNLAVNFGEGYCHCWKCGYASKVSRLVKRFGSVSDYEAYKDESNRIKETYYYQIQNGELVFLDDPNEAEELQMPETKSVHDGTFVGNLALSYLYGRGVDDYIIEKHGICYVGAEWGNKYRNMIIIPSYDMFGELNYFTGRDFTGRKDFNKKNPDVSKSEIMFNEGLVNWYEPITVVEGPFDHIVVPNSIPLLGKSLSPDDYVYRTMMRKCRHSVNLMLDDDAEESMYKLYKVLDRGPLQGKVRIIKCPRGMDPSDIYKAYGRRGMLRFLASAHPLTGFELAKV